MFVFKDSMLTSIAHKSYNPTQNNKRTVTVLYSADAACITRIYSVFFRIWSVAMSWSQSACVIALAKYQVNTFQVLTQNGKNTIRKSCYLLKLDQDHAIMCIVHLISILVHPFSILVQDGNVYKYIHGSCSWNCSQDINKTMKDRKSVV